MAYPSVIQVTRLQAGWLRKLDLIPSSDKRFLPSQKYSARLWSSPSPLYKMSNASMDQKYSNSAPRTNVLLLLVLFTNQLYTAGVGRWFSSDIL
jgi:hypothetical protein